MRFVPQVTKLAPTLGLAALLSGCAAYDSSTSFVNRAASGAFEGVANLGSFMPWGGTRPASPGDSLTVQRVRGVTATSEPLLPEAGNVWPAPEAPRATLMNPDQAMRGIQSYPTPAALAEPGERTERRGSGGPFVPAPTSASPVPPAPQSALPPLAPLPASTSRPGQPIQTPQGSIVPSTTTGNTSTFTSPGGGSGTITRDGNTAIISRPGEPPQVVQTPR
jgi:hypothetical protein